jgi:hypothetical protein
MGSGSIRDVEIVVSSILCRKYSGSLWFALKSAHAFDFKAGAVSRVPLNLLPAPIL